MKKIIGMTLFVLLFCCSCSSDGKNNKKVRDLEFGVVREEEIPEELKQIIEEKKQQNFKLTYADQDQLYIAVGYGSQKTGGYSIQVEELYLAENAIYFRTELKGPKKEEADSQAVSYPYIVVKTEYREESVVFR